REARREQDRLNVRRNRASIPRSIGRRLPRKRGRKEPRKDTASPQVPRPNAPRIKGQGLWRFFFCFVWRACCENSAAFSPPALRRAFGMSRLAAGNGNLDWNSHNGLSRSAHDGMDTVGQSILRDADTPLFLEHTQGHVEG